MTFYVGQKVVCVDDRPNAECLPWQRGEKIQHGHVYTILRLHSHCGDFVCWLEEVRRSDTAIREWGPDVGYRIERFRPLIERKTDISIFTEILDKANSRPRVLEPAGPNDDRTEGRSRC